MSARSFEAGAAEAPANPVADLAREVADLQADLRGLRNRLISVYDNSNRQAEAEIALHSLLQPSVPMPALRGWAMSPDSLLHIVDRMLEIPPLRMVEFGSGSSTIYLGYALKRLGGGRLYSVEHEPRHASATQKLIDAHNLHEFVEVVHAPLCAWTLTARKQLWYDAELLSAALPSVIDIVIVDGPPRSLGREIRYPALPFTSSRLSSTSIAFLDDAHREGEKRVLRAWEAEGFLSYEVLPTEKGLAVCRPSTTDG